MCFNQHKTKKRGKHQHNEKSVICYNDYAVEHKNYIYVNLFFFKEKDK